MFCEIFCRRSLSLLTFVTEVFELADCFQIVTVWKHFFNIYQSRLTIVSVIILQHNQFMLRSCRFLGISNDFFKGKFIRLHETSSKRLTINEKFA